MSTALVRYHPAMNGALFRLRGMLIDLEKTVRGLEREYASDVDKLRQFERRFRPAVGDRYDELERLRERINRGWQALGEAREGRTIRPGPNPEEDSGETVSSPRPEEGARQLFLRLARQIHPDLTADEEERRRRHELMAEATLAYRDNDDRRLQWLLEHWQAERERTDLRFRSRGIVGEDEPPDRLDPLPRAGTAVRLGSVTCFARRPNDARTRAG